MLKKFLLLPFIFLLLTLGFHPSLSPVGQDSPPDICQQSENIMPNCNFNNGTDGWQTFLEEGAASFSVLQGGGECHAPLCPAGYIVTDSHFVGGIYQQVPVAKGNTYYANIVWLVFDSLANDAGINSATGGIGRQMGIDPTGGTDPNSSSVIWGTENRRNDCKICSSQEVTAQAQADKITVFLRIDDRWRLKAAELGYSVPTSKDQFWLDDFGMKQVGGDAVAAPTDTPVPPTDTPQPPTDTPVPSSDADDMPASLESAPTEELAQAEASPEAEATVEESSSTSPVATPPPPPTIAPPPTLTPSATPSPTVTPAETERPRPRATPTRYAAPAAESAAFLPTEFRSAGFLSLAGTTFCVGGVALGLFVAVVGGLVWLYRLGWGSPDDDEPDDDNDKEIVIEIPDNE